MAGVSQASGGCNCPDAGVTCVTCFGTIPDTLSITDANGTYTATWSSTLWSWITPPLCASSQSPIAVCTSGRSACQFESQSGEALYLYRIGCSSSGHMTINRYWFELQCVSPSFQYAICGCDVGAGMQVYSSSGSVEVTCGSIAWSGTLMRIVGNLTDPVVGTTSFSQ